MKTRLLLAAKFHRDSVETMRFTILLKALLLDQTNASQVSEFNQTIQALTDLQTGTKKKQKTPNDVKNIMKDFQENYLKKIVGKAKNFEENK